MSNVRLGAVTAILGLFVAAEAHASCFFIYGAKNELVYRSTISPIDLSRSISDSMRGRYAGGHFTMIPDESGCPDLLVYGQSQQFSAPGTGSRGMVDASPLFRDATSRSSTIVDEGGDASTASSDTRRRAPAALPPARSR